MTYRRQRTIAAISLALVLLMPISVEAAGLTQPQVSAILGLLQAFGADASILASVAVALGGAPSSTSSNPTPSAQSSTPAVRPSTAGSPYIPGTLGYDISYSTIIFPHDSFGFAVVGATAGKAFTHNSKMPYEFSVAKTGAAAGGIYLNLNGPYGRSATTANVSSPKSCDSLFGAALTSNSTGGTYPEPSVCASYNYGYNAAKDALAYTNTLNYVSSQLWWIDIEDANSWSPNVSVNDAVIQGAIDYLNAQGIRAGIYSVPTMWVNIAGAGFTPTQTLGGAAVQIPTWFPIGTNTQVGALNACLDHASLIPGNPIWVIQYELDATSIDQNVAC